jgi:adenosylcobinamide-GDP ribazoletransferase
MNPLARAFALFSVLPVRDGSALTRPAAGAALRLLPLVGAALGATAGLPLAAIRAWAPHATMLGAVLAVVALALLTRALHLDGLADTIDGLGSRAAAPRALEIMRQPDIGPFGVTAVAAVLLVEVAALGSLGGGPWRPVAALALAAATGRCAVLLAAHRRVPSARAAGFGAFVAGSVSTGVLAVAVVLVIGAGAGLAIGVGADVLGWVLAPAGALAVGGLVVRHTTRRLGGVTGDVFGALVEIGTALTLVGLALSVS